MAHASRFEFTRGIDSRNKRERELKEEEEDGIGLRGAKSCLRTKKAERERGGVRVRARGKEEPHEPTRRRRRRRRVLGNRENRERGVTKVERERVNSSKNGIDMATRARRRATSRTTLARVHTTEREPAVDVPAIARVLEISRFQLVFGFDFV